MPQGGIPFPTSDARRSTPAPKPPIPERLRTAQQEPRPEPGSRDCMCGYGFRFARRRSTAKPVNPDCASLHPGDAGYGFRRYAVARMQAAGRNPGMPRSGIQGNNGGRDPEKHDRKRSFADRGKETKTPAGAGVEDCVCGYVFRFARRLSTAKPVNPDCASLHPGHAGY